MGCYLEIDKKNIYFIIFSDYLSKISSLFKIKTQ